MQNDGSFVTAIHVCVYLDKHEGLSSSQAIGKSVGTNPVLIRRVIGQLREHGLLNVSRGKMGGCALSRPASSITLWDVFLAMRKDRLFKVRVRNEEDEIASQLPDALEESLAAAEYSMKKPLAAVTIKQVAAKI